METKEQLIGQRLREARESLKLSRRRAAARAGISEARLRQLENGVQFRDGVATPASTTPETLASIARAVDIEPAALLTEAGIPREVIDRVLEEGTTVTYVADTPPATESKIIDLSRFTPHEQELIETFISGFEMGRKRT